MKLKASATVQWGAFARLEELLVPKLLKGAEAGARVVYDASQAVVAVDKGDLQRSGGVDVEWVGTRVLGYVEYTANHAAFVEFGTGLAGAGTYGWPLPQEGVPITGSWIYDYKKQDWPGMVAQPYLRPSLDGSHGQILEAFRSRLTF